MIIFLYGPDSYRRQEKLKEITADYRKKHSAFSIDHFDLEEDGELGRLKDFSRANSLFDAFKCGVVRNGDALEKSEHKEYITFLKDQLNKKELILVLLFEKKPTKEFSFLLKPPAIIQEFEELTGAQFSLFIKNESEKRDVYLDGISAALLAQAFQGDSWGVITELEKLALLNERKITGDVIKKHLDVLSEMNLFSSLNTMRSARDPGERLRIFEELLEHNDDPAMLFNMIAVAPYEGKQWKEAVANYDTAIKSGRLEYEEVLLDILLRPHT